MSSSASPSLFKTIAVAGGLTPQGPASAGLGAYIARALLKEKANVIVLGRASAIDSPIAKELTALGATIKAVDYDSPSSLEDALAGVDVVISTLSGSGVPAQYPLAVAAKKAGVQLFVPAEFGNNSINLPSTSPLYFKTALQAQLKELGLPSLLVFNGPFADWLPVFLKNDEILVTGEGKADISFTARGDVASFLAHVLTHQPPSTLRAYHTLPIEASRTSLLALAKLLQAKNPSAKIVHESHETALTRFKEKRDFVAWLKVEWDLGGGVVSKEKEGVKNGEWKEWAPKRIEEFI